jgi:hypothetical protein
LQAKAPRRCARSVHEVAAHVVCCTKRRKARPPAYSLPQSLQRHPMSYVASARHRRTPSARANFCSADARRTARLGVRLHSVHG